MADYRIKFEYKGIGKQASSVRQKVLQAQKGARKDVSSTSKDNQVIGSIKSLNTTLQKLIASNKSLETAIKRTSMGGGTSGRMPGGGGMPGSGGAGIGRIGGAIPLVGAAVAALGFTIQKVNQIGNAYIEKTSQQIGNVGVAGFRKGQGVYEAAQVGAGMKAYAMKSGKFSKGVRPNQAALDIGAMYGLSAQETLGMAGTYKRAGADYGTVAAQAAGRGLQSDVPTLLTGIGGLLEEAVRLGINTSDMSKDIGKEITALTLKTSGKSAEAALNIIKSFSGVKTQVGRGKIGSYEGLMTTRATQDILTERLTGENRANYLDRLAEEGMISSAQKEKLMNLKKGAGIEDIQKAVGGSATFALTKKVAREEGPARLLRRSMQQMQKTFGTSPEAMQRAMNVYSQQGGTLTEDQFMAAWKGAREGEPTDVTQKGQAAIRKGAREVETSKAGLSVQRRIQRENLIFQYGASFAKASLEMEKAMIKLAKDAVPTAVTAIEGLSKVVKNLTTSEEQAMANYKKMTGATHRTGNVGLDVILNKIYGDKK